MGRACRLWPSHDSPLLTPSSSSQLRAPGISVPRKNIPSATFRINLSAEISEIGLLCSPSPLRVPGKNPWFPVCSAVSSVSTGVMTSQPLTFRCRNLDFFKI